MRGLNLLIRFLLELGLLAALVYWGMHTGQTASTRIIRAGSAALVALVWGLTLSPKAPAGLSPRLRLALSLPVFWLGAWAMYASDLPRTAIAFAIIATINTGVLFAIQ